MEHALIIKQIFFRLAIEVLKFQNQANLSKKMILIFMNGQVSITHQRRLVLNNVALI